MTEAVKESANMEMPNVMNERQGRGYQIFKTNRILPHPTNGGWIVPSQSGNKKYLVSEDFQCNCPDSEFRKSTCKHAYAVRYYLQVEKDTLHGIETTKVRLTYPQAWKAYNGAQTSEIRLFDELLRDLVEGMDDPVVQKMGRPRLPLKEQVFCAVQKVYSQLSSRRATSLFKNAEDRRQISHAPHFNTISNFLKREEATPLLEELVAITSKPLTAVETDFAIDSSGFRTTSFGEYCKTKHNTKKQHRWLKAHICVGVRTNIITGISVTEENAGDSPQFEPLVWTTSQNGFTIDDVTADKAYSSKANYEAVARVGGQAYIPFKKNATGKARGSYLWSKMYHYFQLNQDEFMEHYHKRSNAETTFHMMKMKFGDKLKSKSFIAQKNELLCKAIAHNIVVLIHEMHELGIEPDFNL